MLQIRIAGRYLDLGDTSLQFTFRNPVFNELDGSATYNFQIPKSSANKVALNFYDRIEKLNVTKSYTNCDILFDGVTFSSGILIINKSTDVHYDCSIGVDKGLFNNIASNLKLSELRYDPVQFNFKRQGEPDSILNVTSQQYPQSPFAIFPVYNPGLYKDTFFDQYFNLSKEIFLKLVNSVNIGFLYMQPDGYFLRLQQEGWIDEYWDAEGNHHTPYEDWLNKIDNFYAVKDRYSADSSGYPVYMYNFYRIFIEFVNSWGIQLSVDDNFKITNTITASGWVNHIDIDFLTHEYTPGKVIAPFPYLCEIIKKSISELGFIQGDIIFMNDTELKTLCLVTMNIVTGMAHLDYPNGSFDIRLNEHMPDVTVLDLFKQVCGFFNCSVFINKNRTIDIRKNTEILKSKIVKEFSANVTFVEAGYERNSYKLVLNCENDNYFSDNVKKDGVSRFERIPDVWSVQDLPSAWFVIKRINVVCWVAGLQSFYITVYENDNLSWKHYSKKDCDLLIDTGADDTISKEFNVGYLLKSLSWYISKSAFLFDQQNLTYPYWEFPRCDFAGNQNNHGISFDSDFIPAPIKLMFYRGYQHFLPNGMSNAAVLPFGSADNMKGSDLMSGVKYSLQWDGSSGIYENFWKEWIYWLNNSARPVKITKLMTVSELANIDWASKYSIDGVHYFIKEIRVDISSKSISPAEIDLIRC